MCAFNSDRSRARRAFCDAECFALTSGLAHIFWLAEITFARVAGRAIAARVAADTRALNSAASNSRAPECFKHRSNCRIAAMNPRPPHCLGDERDDNPISANPHWDFACVRDTAVDASEVPQHARCEKSRRRDTLRACELSFQQSDATLVSGASNIA